MNLQILLLILQNLRKVCIDLSISYVMTSDRCCQMRRMCLSPRPPLRAPHHRSGRPSKKPNTDQGKGLEWMIMEMKYVPMKMISKTVPNCISRKLRQPVTTNRVARIIPSAKNPMIRKKITAMTSMAMIGKTLAVIAIGMMIRGIRGANGIAAHPATMTMMTMRIDTTRNIDIHTIAIGTTVIMTKAGQAQRRTQTTTLRVVKVTVIDG